jgi:hypothetical protein
MNRPHPPNVLRDLRNHWTAGNGPIYLFRYEGRWIATHVGTGQELAAESAEELRVAVADDYVKRETNGRPGL